MFGKNTTTEKRSEVSEEMLERMFGNNPEELKRALGIFVVLTHRIRNQVIPDVERLIADRCKRFFIIPKKLHPEERRVLLGLLCELPLLRAVYDIHNIFERDGKKADRISSYLTQLLSDICGIPINDMTELEEAAACEGGREINIAMSRICERLDCGGDLFLSMELGILCVEKLTLIEAEAVEILCKCPQEELVNRTRTGANITF